MSNRAKFIRFRAIIVGVDVVLFIAITTLILRAGPAHDPNNTAFGSVFWSVVTAVSILGLAKLIYVFSSCIIWAYREDQQTKEKAETQNGSSP